MSEKKQSFSTHHRILPLLTLCLTCLAVGCYERTTRGDRAIYSFAGWLGIAVSVGGIVAIPAGWFLRRISAKWGTVLLVMGPVLLVLVAPAMYNDQVIVDDEHFETRFGLWFSPQTHSVRFRDLKAIEHVGVRGNRNRINYELRCIDQNGQTTIVACGDLVQNAVPEILARARNKQIPVSELSP